MKRINTLLLSLLTLAFAVCTLAYGGENWDRYFVKLFASASASVPMNNFNSATRTGTAPTGGLPIASPLSLTSAFTPGNIVVCRVGDGTASLTSNATAVFLDEYTPAGTFVQSVALPTAISGTNYPLTLSGTATNECQITRSADGRYVIVAGYPALVGTLSVSSSGGPRVIGRVDSNASIDSSTLPDNFLTNGIRSATSNDGTGFWAVGSGVGVVFAQLGISGSGTVISNTVTNNRVINIFDGQLYTSDNSGGAVRLGTVGTGLPTTTGQTISNLPGIPITGAPNGFFFADLNSGIAGVDTLYLADDGSGTGSAGGGVKKFSLVGGTWTYNGTFPASVSPSIPAQAFFGLIGSVNSGTVTLYATRLGTPGNQLVSFVDPSGYNSTPTAIPTLVTTAAANTAFRGVALAPVTPDSAPSVSGTTPTNGATNVAVNSDISITFSEPVNVTGNWFQIVCGSSGTRNASDTVVTGGPTTFTINPNSNFVAGESCTTTVFAAGVTDQDSNDPPDNMSANFVFGFTMVPDQAPSVSATTPTNGATNVSASSNLLITFSEPVNVTGNWLQIICTASGTRNVSDTVVTGGPTTFTINPNSNFAGNETCTTTVFASGVTDQDSSDPPDNMSANFVFAFTTDAAPSVTSTTPTNGATGVATSTNLSITFSEAVNVTGNWFQIVCGSSGTRNVSDTVVTGGPTTFTINPNSDLTVGETCTVTVFAAGVTDQDSNDPPDNMTANFAFAFTMIPDPAPSVSSTTPTNGATNVAVNSDISITFSEPVNVTGNWFQIVCGSSGTQNVADNVVTGGPTTFTINPNSNFVAGESCTTTVFAAGVTDQDSNDPPDNMSANFVFSFTVAAPDISVEDYNSNILTDGVGTVDLGTQNVGASGTAKTFTVRNIGAATLNVNTTISVTGTNAADFVVNNIGMSPTVAPSGNTAFTVTFTPGGAGTRTASLHISSDDPDENPFDIAIQGTGVTPYAITTTTPADGATGVIRNTPISVLFNRATNPLTVTSNTASTSCSGTLQLSRAADNFSTCVQWAGQPVASGGNTTFTATPSSLLDPGTTYLIRVTTNVQDQNGENLPSQFTQATGFTTGSGGPGTLQFSSATYSVSESGPTATITVTRTGGSDGSVGVTYATSNGTATGLGACFAGTDYISTTNSLSWASGDAAAKTFSVAICNDAVAEGDETVNLALSSPTGGATPGAQTSAVLTIQDDDAPPPTLEFSSATYGAPEGSSVTITVTRSGDTSGSSSVHYATSGGNATAGACSSISSADYVATSGTLTFNASETQKTFSVALCPDSYSENPSESFNVTLDSPSGATLGVTSSAAVTTYDAATEFVQSGDIPLDNGVVSTSTLTVGGYAGGASGLRLSLTNVNRQTSGDLWVLLIDPSGTRKMIAMAGSGGTDPLVDATITLEDAAAQFLPSSSPIVSGQNYKPTNCAGSGLILPSPAPAGPYSDPGCGSALTPATFANTFGGFNPNGDWKLYVYDQGANLLGDTGTIGGWGIQFLVPTAAPVSVSGRVITSTGVGIRGASVSIAGGQLGQRLITKTNSFGFFAFTDLEPGMTYIVSIEAKKYVISNPVRVVSLTSDLTGIDFVAEPR